ncbi:MAG: hypothetical protein AAGM33_11720 [Pseudomonadota bacterium]
MTNLLKNVTKGPWYVTSSGDHPLVREVATDAVLAMADDGGHVNPQYALPQATILANAEYIARACNAFPDLVAALEAFCEPWEPGREDLCNKTRIENARIALYKAKGDQS